MHSLISVKDAETGEIHLVLGYSDFYLQHTTFINAVDYFILPSMTFVTFLVVTIATGITIANLKKAMAWRHHSSSSAGDKRQMALVKMLVTVSCVYIACTAPMVALTLTRFLVPDFWTTGRYSNIFHATYQIANTFLMLNSSVNFFVYLGQSSRFKQELACLSCRLCCSLTPVAGFGELHSPPPAAPSF
nr:hypothetical protein BaRGS_032540 [Batillaria attramentaria]